MFQTALMTGLLGLVTAILNLLTAFTKNCREVVASPPPQARVCSCDPIPGKGGVKTSDQILFAIIPTPLCVVTQTTADVKMLMPSFGVVMPQECRVSPAFGGCPPIPPDVCGPLSGVGV